MRAHADIESASLQLDVHCAAASDIFNNCRFDAVIHFAGRKAVGESVEFPMLYYTHNVAGTVNLIEAMRKHKCKQVSTTYDCM